MADSEDDVAAEDAATAQAGANAKKSAAVERVLLGCTGALQMLSIGEYIMAMRSAGAERIGVVLSPSAAAMTSPASLEAIVNEVFVELPMARNHIALSREYQRMAVVPATANFLAGAATGSARNAVELMLIAMPAPSVIVPAMNGAMWAKPVVQRNVATLVEDGHTVLKPTVREVFEAASQKFKRGVSSSTPYEVARAIQEVPA